MNKQKSIEGLREIDAEIDNISERIKELAPNPKSVVVDVIIGILRNAQTALRFLIKFIEVEELENSKRV